MTDLEDRLRAVLNEESTAAPDAHGIASGARRRRRVRRNTRLATVALGLVVALPVGFAVLAKTTHIPTDDVASDATTGSSMRTERAEPQVLHAGSTSVVVGASDSNNIAGVIAGVGLVGKVAITDGGCLGTDGRLVIWPPGTTVRSENPLRIQVPGLGDLAVGDRFYGGGHIFEQGRRPNDVSIPAQCRTNEMMQFWPDR